MSTTTVDYAAAPVAMPTSLGQGTVVEQSRAIAEVQAAVVMARQFPRSIPAAVARMREACANTGLANRAFYSYPKGKTTVSGASVFLARELAMVWGNLQHGLVELRRDDQRGESEMQAFAWDLETNSRYSHTFIVPHRRDTSRGVRKLTDMRDVYENNANMGARRVREAIFTVLPGWFVEDAKNRCNATLQHGGGKPLADRIADALAAFEKRGIVADQLETKLGRSAEQWTPHDLAQLHILVTSLDRGEISREDAFPAQRVTTAEILRAATSPPGATAAAPADTPTAPEAGPAGEPLAAPGRVAWPAVAQPPDARPAQADED